MSNCTSGCLTQDHSSWGECLRAKSLKVGYCKDATGQGDYTKQKKWDKDLQAYRDARRQGIMPPSTSRAHVDAAVRISNERGEAFVAE